MGRQCENADLHSRHSSACWAVGPQLQMVAAKPHVEYLDISTNRDLDSLASGLKFFNR